ncbi:MAG: helix-turn-helix domain-containing protein [Dehalococcoidia bacterium]
MKTPRTFDDLVNELQRDPETAQRLQEMKPSHDLAMMLVSIRLRNAWSQAEFARRAGVSQPYIAQLESGTANPSIRKLDALLRRAGLQLRFEVLPSAEADATSPASAAAGG